MTELELARQMRYAGLSDELALLAQDLKLGERDRLTCQLASNELTRLRAALAAPVAPAEPWHSLLVESAALFRMYEHSHRMKGAGHEGKMKRNADIAGRIENALSEASVGDKPATSEAVSDEAVREAFRAFDANFPMRLRTSWQVWRDAVEWSGKVYTAPPDVQRDAERYRWLRDVSVPPHNFYLSVPIEFDGVKYSKSEVDTYIDAAMAAKVPT